MSLRCKPNQNCLLFLLYSLIGQTSEHSVPLEEGSGDRPLAKAGAPEETSSLYAAAVRKPQTSSFAQAVAPTGKPPAPLVAPPGEQLSGNKSYADMLKRKCSGGPQEANVDFNPSSILDDLIAERGNLIFPLPVGLVTCQALCIKCRSRLFWCCSSVSLFILLHPIQMSYLLINCFVAFHVFEVEMQCSNLL